MFFKRATSRPVFLSLLYLVTAWFVNYAVGLLSFEHTRDSIQARDAGAALVLPLITSLLWMAQKMVVAAGVSAISHIAGHRRTRSSVYLANTLHNIIVHNLRRMLFFLIIAASVIAFSYLYSEGLLQPSELENQNSAIRYLLFFQAIPFWFCILRFLFTLFIVFKLSKIYITKYLRVRLFEVEELSPICNLVIINMLVSTMVLSVYPLNLLFIDLPETDKYVLLIFGLISVVFLLYPVYLVQLELRERKSLTLERINQSLESQMLGNTEDPEHRRLVDDEQRLQFISDLLIVRKEVNQAPLWPVNIPFTLKMSLIFLLPLLSWLGAGVVSQVIKPWVQL